MNLKGHSLRLAAAIGASERTVRRDIAELQEAGIDIETTKQANRVFAFLAAERARLSPPQALAFLRAPPVPKGFRPRGAAAAP